jgi:hypothetical protein
MKKSGTIRVAHEPGDPPLKTDTDWARVAALTDEEIHAAALADPDAQPLPRDGRGLTKLVNVKKLREKLGMTQEMFAELYRAEAQESGRSRSCLSAGDREQPGYGSRAPEGEHPRK